jgi:hypothetical protein
MIFQACEFFAPRSQTWSFHARCDRQSDADQCNFPDTGWHASLWKIRGRYLPEVDEA